MSKRIKLAGHVTDDASASMYRRWGYNNVCCPNDVREALDDEEEDEIILELNSSGGSVYAGFEMYTLLRQSDKNITAEIQSIAASSMSVVAAGCKNVLMSPVAHIMVHRSSTCSGGNAERLEQDAQMLNTIDESILNAYEEKSGGKISREELRDMMKNETFMTAEQAIECGLADGMLDKPEKEKGKAQLAIASAGFMPELIGLPDIEDLKRMEAEREGKPEDSAENKEEGGEESMEINSMEELRNVCPKELLDELAAEAAKAERERLTAIDDVTVAGFEEIAAEAKADANKTAADVAIAIAKAVKNQGRDYLKDVQDDADDLKDVNSQPMPEDKPKDENDAEAMRADIADIMSLMNEKKGE